MGCLFSRNKQNNTQLLSQLINQSKNKQIIQIEPQIHQLPQELLTLLHQNKIEIQKKFYDVLNRNPSETDGVGFIYGFTKDNDYKWIKIGRTIHANPNKRVNEWKGDILFCQKTIYNKKIETLIHLLLKNRNIHRMNIKTGGNEIEWFYLDVYINLPKILAILIEYVEHNYIHDYTITTPSQVA